MWDLPGVTDDNGVVFHPFADREPYQDCGHGAGNTGAGNGRFDWNDANANGQHDAGESSEPFTDTGADPENPARRTAAWGFGDGRYKMGDPVAEDVNAFLITDWSNHRNSNFSTNAVRDDLFVFGEHLGAPPNPGDYLAAGMRMANDDFANNVGGFNGIGASMAGYDNPGQFTFGVNGGMMYCLSHDNNSMAGSERPAAHQYMLTRAGAPIVYTDGYNIAGGPSFFPSGLTSRSSANTARLTSPAPCPCGAILCAAINGRCGRARMSAGGSFATLVKTHP